MALSPAARHRSQVMQAGLPLLDLVSAGREDREGFELIKASKIKAHKDIPRL